MRNRFWFELGRVCIVGNRLYKLISSWPISCTSHKSFRESCGWYPVKQVIFLFFFRWVKDRTEKADQTIGYRTSRGCHSYEGQWCLMMGNDW